MIPDNVSEIKKQITFACSRVGRNPDDITIVAVSKTRTADEIQEVINSGIIDIGENRVQDALNKYNILAQRHIRWHLVGHLQTNKIKDAVRIFDLIHSVDSLKLAQEIDRQAQKIGKVQDILLEVKTSEEPTKYGFKEEEVIEAVKEVNQLKNIRLRGLMTIAPIVENPESARPYFRTLRELRDRIYELPACRQASEFTSYELGDLSMGMTDDFEVAIEEGSTMVRIGRAIFE